MGHDLMDSLLADATFGWRQLWKRKVMTLAAVASLGLAICSCVVTKIGIRIALGAPASNIARIVSARMLLMVLAGAVAGLAAAMGSVRFVHALLYGVSGTAISMTAMSMIVLLAAAMCAAVPAVLRAVRIDPAIMLRAE